MRNLFGLVVVGLAVVTAVHGVVLPAAATAQVLEGPARPFRQLFRGGPAPDPNRTRQEVTLTANAVGGWEDGFVPGAPGLGDLSSGESAYTGLAEARLRYFSGRLLHSLSVDGRAFTNSYNVPGGLPSIFGGDAQVRVDQPLGGSDRFRFRQGIAYEPLLTLGGFGPLDAGIEPSALPVSDPTAGLVEQSSLRLTSAVALTHDWNRRHSTAANYTYTHQNHLDEFGFDSRTHDASASHALSLTRRTSLRVGYGYTEVTDIETISAPRRSTAHGVDVGFGYEKALSRTRRLSVTGAIGAAHVITPQEVTNEPVEYWTPSGQGSVGLDFGRTWSLRGGYASGLTMLNSVTRQMFYTHAVEFQIGGLIGRRLEAALSAGLSGGRTGGGVGLEVGRYQTSVATAQLTWALTRWCASILNYSYYHYRLEDVTLSAGVPSRLDRNAVRAGISFWLPLHTVTRPTEGGRGDR